MRSTSNWDVLKDRLAKLLKAVESDDYPQVRQLLREVVSGYVPEGEIVDWIYQQRRGRARVANGVT